VSLLFEEPLIAGLKYRESLIGSREEAVLIDRLTGLELAPFRFHGFIGNRKTMSFGWRYDFDDASFTRTEPIPDWLQPLRNEAAAFASLDPDDFVHALIARYDANAGIGWHRDRDVFEQVVGVSLGTPATLRFRQRTPTGFLRASQLLEPRSAYLLSGSARWEWEHSISAGDQLRFSITLRTLSDKGRRVAGLG
jgi:alkylated DNA repair protein (DNA oxidative demethylase)